MIIDLHTHTRGSDGKCTPQELIDLAISKGIRALAITDHDTIDSIEIAIQYSKDKDIIFIPGIEFNCECSFGKMHMLGLGINHRNEYLLKKLEIIKIERNIRNLELLKGLRKMGIEITMEDVEKVSNGSIIGKPHFAIVMAKKGYADNPKDVFTKFFDIPPLNQYVRKSFGAKEVINIIKNAGGIAVLAHPQTLKLDYEKLEEEVIRLKSFGLDGIECYHSSQTIEEMTKFKKIAIQNGLIYSKGSDYHGENAQRERLLGTGTNCNILNDEEDDILRNILNTINYFYL